MPGARETAVSKTGVVSTLSDLTILEEDDSKQTAQRKTIPCQTFEASGARGAEKEALAAGPATEMGHEQLEARAEGLRPGGGRRVEERGAGPGEVWPAERPRGRGDGGGARLSVSPALQASSQPLGLSVPQFPRLAEIMCPPSPELVWGVSMVLQARGLARGPGRAKGRASGD